MSDMNKPNVARDLAYIHRVITRGLEVAAEQSRTFAREGFPDASTRAGFASYVQALAAVLHGHHTTEDDLAFPYFRDKLPEMPVDALMADHRKMEPMLEEIKVAVEALGGEAPASAALNDLNGALVRMAELWRPHIQTEEKHLSPDRLEAMLDVEEQINLGRQFAQHSQEQAGPDYLVVPFMLYNLSAEDRAMFSRAMPPVVTQQLVPVVWKEKWEPMRPFLLD